MSDYAIRVDNLGKRFVISHRHDAGYKTLRDSLASLFKPKLTNTTEDILGSPGPVI